MIQAFIAKNGVTVLPPRHAHGTGLYKPTAYGSSRDDTEWLTGKVTARSNEEALAKAKILTMIQDLAGKRTFDGNPNARLKLKNDAYRFFFSPKSDFEDWCDTAGLDPDYVREKARKVHEEGMPQWRAKPGEGKHFHRRKQHRLKQKEPIV